MTELRKLVQKLIHKIAIQYFDFPDYYLGGEFFINRSLNKSAYIFTAVLLEKDFTKNYYLLKVAALDEHTRSKFPVEIYNIEINFHKNLVTDYKLLQNEYRVFGKERLSTVRFYGCHEKYLEEALAFEDTHKLGFRTHHRIQSINWQFAIAAVTELAKLHALSFSLNFHQPREYEEHLNVFRFNLPTEETEDSRIFWNNVIDAAVEVTAGENKEKLKKYLQKNLPHGINKFFEPLRKPVLGHGDFRTGNMIYRKSIEDELELIIVNYQTMREISPVVDLIYLIVTGTDEEFRRNYFDVLKIYYYAELCICMKRLGLNPITTYSKKDFNFEWDQKFPFGLCVAAFFLPIITLNKIPKNFIELMKCHTTNKTKQFTKCMNEIVDDFIRWRLL